MTPHDYLASQYQEAAVQQAAIHGFTYSRMLSKRCRLSPEAANGVLGALVFKKIFTSFPLWDRVNGYKLTRFACDVLDMPRTLSRTRGEQSYIFRIARLVDSERRDVRQAVTSRTLSAIEWFGRAVSASECSFQVAAKLRPLPNASREPPTTLSHESSWTWSKTFNTCLLGGFTHEPPQPGRFPV